MIMGGALIACAAAVWPISSGACSLGATDQCKKRFEALVAYRAEAIEAEFGDVFGDLPADIKIEFVGRRAPQYATFGGNEGYDQQRRTLVFPLRLLGSKTPNPLRWAVYYWPFYEKQEYREAFPIVEIVDNLLWRAYLQEAAGRRGLSWPHEGCASEDLAERLPCEMLVEGITEHLKDRRGSIFNANRVDMIWPEDFADFREHLWRKGDEKYHNVKHYGGILLVGPLIEEFGFARALTYIAQTPFHIEDNNLRLSALRYQERARREIM